MLAVEPLSHSGGPDLPGTPSPGGTHNFLSSANAEGEMRPNTAKMNKQQRVLRSIATSGFDM